MVFKSIRNSVYKYWKSCFINIGSTIGVIVLNKDKSGFTYNTLLIPKQDLLMVYIVRFSTPDTTRFVRLIWRLSTMYESKCTHMCMQYFKIMHNGKCKRNICFLKCRQVHVCVHACIHIVFYRIAKCIGEITRGSILSLFNDEWIDLRLNEMFVQQ